jgi:lysophospholipase L1-like esterase
MKKVLINISIVLISVFLTVLVLELVLRAVYKFKFSPRGLARIPVAKTYKLSENKNLLYELLPDSKARNRGVDFVINSFGFRDKEYQKKKVSKIRLIFVGDSITYGWGIPLKHTYHKRLERRFHARGHDVDIMGMGVVGYNTIQQYHLIKEKTLDFNADMIILQIAMNDFERTLRIRAFEEGKKLSVSPLHDYSIPFIIKRTRLTHFFMKNSHLFKFINLKLYWIKNKRNPGFTPKDMYLMGEENSFHHLRQIKKLLDSKEIPLAAVIFPFRKSKDVYPYTRLQNRIHQELEKMGVPYLDLYDVLNIETEESIWNIWRDRMHPTVRGHNLASRALIRFLKPLLQSNE